MKAPSILIIEDEKPAARALQRKLNQKGYTVERLLHSVAEAKAWFASNQEPDLVFMDIQLSDGLSFEILEEYPIQSAIIFTTAYDEFALKAFKLNSIDYLLKPIIEEELDFAVQKFLKQSQNNSAFNFDSLKELLYKPTEEYKTRLTIKIGQMLKVVEMQQVACFYAENKGTYCLTKSNDQYLIDHTIEQLESMLSPKDFFRINRGQLIQIQAIKDIAVHSNSRLKIHLTVENNLDLVVSREKVADFKNWIG